MGFSSKQKMKLAMNVRNSAFNILLGQKWHEYLCLWSISMQMDRQRVFREISDPYDFSNGDFYNRYRFYKEDIPYLVNEFCLGLELYT